MPPIEQLSFRCDCGRHHAYVPPGDLRDPDAVERARVVGVLDAWAIKQKGEQWSLREEEVFENETEAEAFRFTVVLGFDEDHYYSAPTPDAARSAAAKAIESGEVS